MSKDGAIVTESLRPSIILVYTETPLLVYIYHYVESSHCVLILLRNQKSHQVESVINKLIIGDKCRL